MRKKKVKKLTSKVKGHFHNCANCTESIFHFKPRCKKNVLCDSCIEKGKKLNKNGTFTKDTVSKDTVDITLEETERNSATLSKAIRTRETRCGSPMDMRIKERLGLKEPTLDDALLQEALKDVPFTKIKVINMSMSVVNLQVLLHYYCECVSHPDLKDDIKSQHIKTTLIKLLQCGLIESENKSPLKSGSGYNVTERGRVFVSMLTSTPLPVQKWTAPRNSVINS